MAGTQAVATTSPVPSTTAFIDSIGVNTHIDSGQPLWMNAARLGQEMQFLGIKHVRDGTPYSWALPIYVQLASAGVKFDLQQENPTSGPLTVISAMQDVNRAAALNAAVPSSVESMEGANEYNLWHISLNGIDSYNNLAWGALDAQDLQSAVRRSSVLDGTLLVAPTTALVSSGQNIGNDVDASNWHVYGGVGQQLAGAMSLGVSNAEATAPGKPVFITETGISSSGYGSSLWGVTDERTQAIIDLNAVFDASHAGVFRTFLYELMDEPAKGGQEGAFGLFTSDGTAKPIATAIHNTVAILSNGGPVVAGTGTGTVGYSLSGLPSTASAMLLQQPNGLYDLVVWNGQALVSDGTQTLQPAPVQVHLSLTSGQAGFKVYDPMIGTAPLADIGLAAGMNFAISADPVIISIAAATNPITLGTGSASIVVNLSEDAWQGDAQFNLRVDGKQIGGTQTATAPHGQGAGQAFTLLGNFGTGAHTVTATFLNDAYGGTSATDRNLYVDSITTGSTTVTESAALLSNGSRSFAVTLPTSSAVAAINPVTLGTGSASIVVNLSEDAWHGDAQVNLQVDGQPIGGTQTATAPHGQGAGQAFTLLGNFGTGAHTVTATFLNDAYGGTSATDRNLYVDSITAGSTTVTESAAMLSNGSRSFTIYLGHPN